MDASSDWPPTDEDAADVVRARPAFFDSPKGRGPRRLAYEASFLGWGSTLCFLKRRWWFEEDGRDEGGGSPSPVAAGAGAVAGGGLIVLALAVERPEPSSSPNFMVYSLRAHR